MNCSRASPPRPVRAASLPCPVTHRPPRRRGSSWADVGASASTSPTATTCSPSARTCWKRGARWSSTATRGDRHVPRAPNPPCVWPMPGPYRTTRPRAPISGCPSSPVRSCSCSSASPASSSRTAWPPPPEGWMTSRRWSPSGPRKKSAKSRASCPNVSPPSSTDSKRPRSLSWSSVPTWIRAAAPALSASAWRSTCSSTA